MLLLLTNAGTDKLQLVTSATAPVDVHVSWVDKNTSTGAISEGRTNTAIASATTTDITATPAATTNRNIKALTVRNKDATASNDVTVVYDANGTDCELYKVTLLAGDTLQFIEGVGFYVLTATARMLRMLRVASDVINATTSFADITGLTCPVMSGRQYNFLANLYHQTNATTTGAQFGINGPAMISMILSSIAQITASVTAATYGSSASVTALDTAAVVETTGPGAVNMLVIVSGYFNPSANGNFAMRCKSEVAVASGLTVKAGSWCNVWETTG